MRGAVAAGKANAHSPLCAAASKRQTRVFHASRPPFPRNLLKCARDKCCRRPRDVALVLHARPHLWPITVEGARLGKRIYCAAALDQTARGNCIDFSVSPSLSRTRLTRFLIISNRVLALVYLAGALHRPAPAAGSRPIAAHQQDGGVHPAGDRQELSGRAARDQTARHHQLHRGHAHGARSKLLPSGEPRASSKCQCSSLCRLPGENGVGRPTNAIAPRVSLCIRAP